uniref:Uncharacterized protein n=1 Tax=Hyaloperonospora arabidopsidis (strain Emoy2) TaxID=559515 RepID=M4BUZ5_HYAAE
MGVGRAAWPERCLTALSLSLNDGSRLSLTSKRRRRIRPTRCWQTQRQGRPRSSAGT